VHNGEKQVRIDLRPRSGIPRSGRAELLHRRDSAPEPPRSPKGSFPWKGIFVVVGAMALTTVAIRASDMSMFADPSFLAGAAKSTDDSRCPAGMAYVPTAQGGFCIDQYEVSPGKECANTEPKSKLDTDRNMTNSYCLPVSVKGGLPWVNVTLHQALDLCARAGKRLPSPGEWFRAALGTPEDVGTKDGCVLGMTGKQNADPTGMRLRCVSHHGAYDMVGNVWEWVEADVVDGTHFGRELPDEGYIAEADTNGIPTQTEATTSSELFNEDFHYINKTGVMAMFRGGFWNMDERAGTFTVNAANTASFSGGAVGFRCVK